MSENNVVTQIDTSFKNNIKIIMESMDIEFIYHIDDIYEDDNNFLLNCITNIDKIEDEFLSELINISDLELISTFSKETKQEYLRKALPKISVKNINRLKENINLNNQYDEQATTIIDRMLEADKIVKVSPSSWYENKDHYINEFRLKKVLLFIDSDWGRGNNYEGIKLILELIGKACISDNIKYALFTHLYTEAEQFKKREELAKEHGIPLEKLFVLSKQDREDNNFIRDFRTIAIMPTLRILKKTIYDHIIDSSVKVKSYIFNELDIIDVEYITLDKSSKEGDWEPNILYRLHSNRHMKEFREKIFNDDSIQKNILLMRNLKKISPEIPIISLKGREIMEYELYDNKVNKYNCPLKSGDIFKTGSKYFILLMQPCEMMIRNNGKRGTNHEYKCFANLVEISRNENNYPIKYFDCIDDYYLQFTKIKKVELDILDLCTYSTDGKCEINLSKTKFSHKLEGIERRYEILHQKYKKLHELWINTTPTRNPDLRKYLFMPYGKGILNVSIPNSGDQIINFGLKRVKRLSKEVAHDFHVKLLHYLSRSAMDMDLE